MAKPDTKVYGVGLVCLVADIGCCCPGYVYWASSAVADGLASCAML